MILKKLDFSHKELEELNSTDIPNDTEELDVSYNNLFELDFSTFFKKIRVWFLNLSHNQLSSLSFLRCFKSIGFLDVSDNLIEIDDLFDLRDIVIVRINLKNEYFNHLSKSDPYVIPTILRHSWIINDDFITDYQRECYSKYEETLEFGNSILLWRRFKGPKPVHSSVHQAGKNYILDHQIESQTEKDVIFNPPLGESAYRTDDKSQLDKIKYLSNSFLFQFQLPKGEFEDYFGLTLGILSVLWVGGQVDSIPRLLCRSYWFCVSEDVNKMKNWELFVLLFVISNQIRQQNENFQMHIEIWKSLTVEKYLEVGKIPIVGSTPRMILAAFMSRAIAITECEFSETFSNDLRAYFKYRKTCGLVQLDQTINSVYLELIAPFYQPKNIQRPMKNDRINCIHPLSGEWISSKIKYVKNGRIFILLDDVISQIPSYSVFWDTRLGIWREDSKKSVKMPEINLRKAQPFRRKKMFITASTRFTNPEDEISTKNNEEDEINIKNNVEEEDDSDINLSNIDKLINRNNMVNFIPKPPDSVRAGNFNRRVFEPTPVNYDESKLMPGWRTFRGIVDPPRTRSKRINRVHAGLGPGQSIQDVVNVVKGNDYSNGKRVKRYNVKIFNVLTKKNKFAWITEDEISKKDVKKLNEIYQRHTTNKLNKSATKF